MTKFMHTTKGGQKIPLNKLEDSHLQNIINLIERKAKEGIIVRYGGGSKPDDFWYDEDHLYGEEALNKMHYYEYIEERERRQKNRKV